MVRSVDVYGKVFTSLIGGKDFVACHLRQWKREESSSQVSRTDAADEATDNAVSGAQSEVVDAVAEHGLPIVFVTVKHETRGLNDVGLGVLERFELDVQNLFADWNFAAIGQFFHQHEHQCPLWIDCLAVRLFRLVYGDPGVQKFEDWFLNRSRLLVIKLGAGAKNRLA
jgi:hypothetical protein